jgi:hypothetical protein
MLASKPTFKITTVHTLDMMLDGEDLEWTVEDRDEDTIALVSGDVALHIRRDDLKSLANCFGVQPS